jgi:very-short-patch-repair endonuclease
MHGLQLRSRIFPSPRVAWGGGPRSGGGGRISIHIRQIDANKFLNSSVADFCAGTPMAKVLRKTRSRARILRRRLTNAETILWSRLRGSVCGTRFRRQHPIGPYIADFACISASIVIEIDGETHSTKAACEHDKRRDAYLRSRGWQIVRVWNRDVYESLDSVLESILGAVRGASPAVIAPSTASRSPSPTLRTGEEK